MMTSEKPIPSPDGRYVVQVMAWEALMSHWVFKPELRESLNQTCLFSFSNNNWSLDSAVWEGSSVVRMALRNYPGHQTPTPLVVRFDCENLTASLENGLTVPFSQLEEVLEQSLGSSPSSIQVEPSTLADNAHATSLKTSPNPLLLKILAWSHIILGALVLLIELWLVTAAWQSLELGYREFLSWDIQDWGIVLFFVLPFCLSLLAGIGLLKNRRWARIIITILSVLYLPALPIGTVLGGLGFWVLYLSEATNKLRAPTKDSAPIIDNI